MKTIRTIALTAVAAAVTISGATAFLSQGRGDTSELPEVAGQPVGLVYAQPFFLDTPYQHAWRADQPSVQAGYLVVVTADTSLLEVRQTLNPILMIGDQVVERVNNGDVSGHAIGILPAPGSPETGVDLDLASTPIYFATPDGDFRVPAEITPEIAQRELQRALSSGITGQATLAEQAVAISGGALYAADYDELYLRAADLVETYSIDEQHLITGLRAPRVQ